MKTKDPKLVIRRAGSFSGGADLLKTSGCSEPAFLRVQICLHLCPSNPHSSYVKPILIPYYKYFIWDLSLGQRRNKV